MSDERLQVRPRPTYPSQSKQWFGILLTLFSVVCLQVLGAFYNLQSPGSILFLIVVFVTYWSGLRTGIIACAISLFYLSYAYSIPGQYLYFDKLKHARIISSCIVLPLFALIVGTVQGKLRNAATREWDAREKAEAEKTQRRQAEGDLRSREDMWRLVLDSAMDGIIAIDDNGRVTLWNRNAEAMFGWNSEEMAGVVLADRIVPESYRDAHDNGLRRFVETGEANIFGKRLELTGLAKDGREFPVELTVVPHQTENGHVFISFVRDMTEAKLLNERLRQAQKMQAIGTLAGGIAHDFNNILAAISGNLVLARADVPPDHPIQDSLREIDKAATRATYVVRQILTFSSVKETKPEVIDIAETLSEAVKLLRATIPASTETQTDFPPNLPPVLADSTDIHQIVLNLGINAHHAMGGLGGKFIIKAREVELNEEKMKSPLGLSPGRYVRVTVTDTGGGMSPQTLQRLFEPFFTTKATGEGTGLGLAVVYGIVERHQGAITVSSELGIGTSFDLYFPVASVAAEPVEDLPLEAQAGNGERILYIDDDESLVYLMERVLSRLNYTVAGFDDPREGLAAFQADPRGFDLVITDMSMPGIDGPALVHELQAIRRDVPIVMVTGYIRPSDLEKAHDLGIQELILKPNTVHEMAETLHRILSELRVQRT